MEDDNPPPDDDPTPWTVFAYKPPQNAAKWGSNMIRPQSGLWIIQKPKFISVNKTREITRDVELKISDAVATLHKESKRLRDILSTQIEQAFTKTFALSKKPHPCYVDERTMKIRNFVSMQSGSLHLKELPGQESCRYTLEGMWQVPYILAPNVSFADVKPNNSTHVAINRCAVAMGYETGEQSLKVEQRPTWLTPEVLRAARVFMKQVPSGQLVNQRHRTETLKREKPEPLETPEHKQMKLGGPFRLPVEWRNKDPSKVGNEGLFMGTSISQLLGPCKKDDQYQMA